MINAFNQQIDKRVITIPNRRNHPNHPNRHNSNQNNKQG
jgi:hypothetical protein